MCMCAYEGLNLLLKKMQRFYKVAKRNDETKFAAYKEQLTTFGKLSEHFNVPLFDVSESLCCTYETQLETLYDLFDSFDANDKCDELKCLISEELQQCEKYHKLLNERITRERQNSLLEAARNSFVQSYNNMIDYIKNSSMNNDEYIGNIISDLDFHVKLLLQSNSTLTISLFKNTLDELLKIIIHHDCKSIVHYNDNPELKRLVRNVTASNYLNVDYSKKAVCK